MTRVLAVVGAVCLILAAVLARAVLTDDDGDDGGGEDGGELVVACIPELEVACRDFARNVDRTVVLHVESPFSTIDRLEAGEDVDAWVTFDPWPAMAGFTVRDDSLDVVEAVASQPLATVVRTGFADGCDAPPTWACLQDTDARQVSLPTPDSALGALAVGAATADVFEALTGSPRFAAQDIAAGGPADAYLEGYEFGREPIGDMLQLGTAGPKATIALAAEAEARIGRSREDGNLVIEPLRSAATVAVVVAGPRATLVSGDGSFTESLADEGWAVDPAAATTGLPDAGALVALQGVVP